MLMCWLLWLGGCGFGLFECFLICVGRLIMFIVYCDRRDYICFFVCLFVWLRLVYIVIFFVVCMILCRLRLRLSWWRLLLVRWRIMLILSFRFVLFLLRSSVLSWLSIICGCCGLIISSCYILRSIFSCISCSMRWLSWLVLLVLRVFWMLFRLMSCLLRLIRLLRFFGRLRRLFEFFGWFFWSFGFFCGGWGFVVFVCVEFWIGDLLVFFWCFGLILKVLYVVLD